VELAVELCGDKSPATILDIGTGSGCLLATLLHEFPEATGTGIDISESALAIAAENIDRLGFVHRARLEQVDFRSGLTGRYDLIISNPPYIAELERPHLPVDVRDYEPPIALFAGDGYEAYRIIIARLPALLRPNGKAVFEVGQGQADEVKSMISDAFGQALKPARITVRNDLSGIERAVGVWLTA
jgi:release factor glutamine methyltransferase